MISVNKLPIYRDKYIVWLIRCLSCLSYTDNHMENSKIKSDCSHIEHHTCIGDIQCLRSYKN